MRGTRFLITQSPTVITIMLVSGGISQSDSILKAVRMFRESKFVYYSESHRDRHYVIVP